MSETDSPSKALVLIPGALFAVVALALLAFGLIERRRVADILKETTVMAEETRHDADAQKDAYRKLQLRIAELEAENTHLRELLAQQPAAGEQGGSVVVGAGSGRVRPIG
jgi:cell shape-determining protein MreC